MDVAAHGQDRALALARTEDCTAGFSIALRISIVASSSIRIVA